VNKENTPPLNQSQEDIHATPEGLNGKENEAAPPTAQRERNHRPIELIGIPVNLLCRSREMQKFMGVSNETWGRLVAAAEELGLVIDRRPGTREGWGLTSDLHELFRANPVLEVRKSAVRQQRKEERQKKK